MRIQLVNGSTVVFETLSEVIEMKQVSCSSPSCGARRAHHEGPDEPRGVQSFWVEEGAEGPFFCSIECQLYYKIESRPKELGPGEEN